MNSSKDNSKIEEGICSNRDNNNVTIEIISKDVK